MNASSHLLNESGTTRDVFARNLPPESEVTVLYDEPLNGNLAVSYGSYDQDAQGNTIVTTNHMNTPEIIAVQKTGTVDWFRRGDYLRCGIQTTHDTPTKWCLAEVIYSSTVAGPDPLALVVG